MTTKIHENQTRKLPLWRGLLEAITSNGLEHGKVYQANYFENELSCKRDTREFGIATYRIRRALEEQGYYLQGHAMRDGTMVIIAPDRHIGVVKNRERIRKSLIERNIALLANTNRKLLSSIGVQRKHEKTLERLKIKHLIEQRAGRIHKLLTIKAPKMLK